MRGCGCGKRRAWVRRQLTRIDPRAGQLTDQQVTAITFVTLGAAAAGLTAWLLVHDIGEEGDHGGNPVQH